MEEPNFLQEMKDRLLVIQEDIEKNPENAEQYADEVFSLVGKLAEKIANL